MPKSLNRVQLIGNLTRDPELRYTPNGTAVCSFGLATNRSWTTDAGEKREETEFHRVVSWNKLAELCSQFLVKGRKVYVEGRLQTRNWTGQDGTQRTTTEIVIDDMILLDSKRPGEEVFRGTSASVPDAAPASQGEPASPTPQPPQEEETVAPSDKKKTTKNTQKTDLPARSAGGPAGRQDEEEPVSAEDIPF